jgi:surfactin synthase thioesterase subunit
VAAVNEADRAEKAAAAPTRPNPWIVGRTAAGPSAVRLLCFAQAGGSAGAFAAWRGVLPAGLELLPVELPGHGTRRAEAAPRTMAALAGAAVDALRGELDAPYALFGHSFGALVAYELAREIRRRGLPAPRGLLLSGTRPPHIPVPDTPHGRMHLQDDAALTQWLRRTNGLPEELLRHADYVRVVLETVRADATLTARYLGGPHGPPEPVDCPLHVMGGLADPVVRPAELEDWADYEGLDLTLTLYPGDHYYLYQAPRPLLDDIARLLGAGSPTEGKNTR